MLDFLNESMQTPHRLTEDLSRNFGRRGFLGLSLLAIGGSALGGLDTVASAPAEDRMFETQRWSGFRSILSDSDGYLLTGIRTNGADEQVGWGLRLNEDFDVMWNRTYLSPAHLEDTDIGEENDGIEFALPDGDGGFLLVGWRHELQSDSRYGWVWQIGEDGIPWLARSYFRENVNSFRDDFADGVAIDDGFLLVGRTIAGEYLDEERGDGWIVEIDGDRGRVRWQQSYDPSGTSDGLSNDDRHAEFNAVTPVDDGYLVVGEASPDGPTEDTSTAAWALRIDGDGDPRWSRHYRLDSDQNNEFRDVVAVDDGFLVAGVAGEEESVSELHDYEMQGRSWAAKLDPQGQLLWENSPGGEGFHAVESTANGGVFVGRRDGQGWTVVYDDNGERIGTDSSSMSGSEYTAVTSRNGGSTGELLAAGHGRKSGGTHGLLSRFTGDLYEDDGGDTDDEERHVELNTSADVAEYWITVDGDARPGDEADTFSHEYEDTVECEDGTCEIHGYVGGEDDYYIQGEIISAKADEPVTATVEGETMPLEDLPD